ncbi:MAG TPA: Sbal_3080 family lipoprotein [Rhodanobacter sp.]
MKYLLAASLMLGLAACTSVKVKPVDTSLAMHRVCIQTNPAVKVDDFVMVMQDGFQRHGIAAQVYDSTLPASCEYVVDYTALRSWDFKPYLSHAEIRITDHGRLVASATYHLNGKGGFDMGKWRGTKAKIAPVMDELLAGFHP